MPIYASESDLPCLYTTLRTVWPFEAGRARGVDGTAWLLALTLRVAFVAEGSIFAVRTRADPGVDGVVVVSCALFGGGDIADRSSSDA